MDLTMTIACGIPNYGSCIDYLKELLGYVVIQTCLYLLGNGDGLADEA